MSDWNAETAPIIPRGGPSTGRRPSTLARLSRARRVYSAWSWGNWLWSLFTSKSGVATAVVLAGASGGAIVATVRPELLGLTGHPAKVEVKAAPLGHGSIVYAVRGADRTGRRVLFDIIALNRDYAWVHGSDRELSKGDRILGEREILADVLDNSLREGLAPSREVIAVGVASVEGESRAESDRAERRARMAAGWLAAVVAPGVTVSTLNLGQFKSACSGTIAGNTAWQRPLLIIGVREKDQGAEVAEALADALSGKSNLPSPDCYTDLRLSRFR